MDFPDFMAAEFAFDGFDGVLSTDSWHNSVAVSAEPLIAVSASYDHTVRVWNLRTGAEMATASLRLAFSAGQSLWPIAMPMPMPMIPLQNWKRAENAITRAGRVPVGRPTAVALDTALVVGLN